MSRRDDNPNVIHNYDALNSYKDPFMLWFNRQHYKQRKTDPELFKFFKERKVWHNKLSNAVKPEGAKLDYVIKDYLRDIAFMGNADILYEDNPETHIYEIKGFFHIPNTRLPYHVNLVQTLQYGGMADFIGLENIVCHVIYLNKGFEFKYDPELMNALTELNLYNAKRSIETDIAPLRCPLKGQCNNCFIPNEICYRKRRFERQRWEISGS